MLKTYEVMIKDGQLTWLDEQPKIASAHAIITILEGETDFEKKLLEEHIISAKDESRQEILIKKASQILAQLDGEKAKEQIEEEIAKDEEMKKILGQKASQILARLGGSQPDLQPIPRRRFQEMADDLS